MKSAPKLIRRYVGIMLLSCVLLLVLNFVLLVVFTARQAPNAYPWKTAEEVADALQQTDDGGYDLPDAVSLELKNSDAWAIFIDDETNQLRRKEMARANWIAGVSRDIRTPLSMVMGYAGQLRDDAHITEEERRKAAVIVKQSERMRNLINDLNLASKLEYNMQPIHPKKENLIAIVREVVVDFINMDMDDKHPIEWETDESLTFCPVNADKDLMERAIGNLIQNSINHNGRGCKIYVSVSAQNGQSTITVADDGIGAADEQFQKLNKAPHYMVCDENVAEQRHGLGLLLVKQIIAAHGGSAAIGHSSYGGFCVKITLPVQE